MMRNLGKNPTEEQLAEMIADIDADSNGSIGLAEFCTLFAQAGGDEPEEPLQQPAPSQASQPGSPPKSPKKQSSSNPAAAATARRLKAVGCTPLMPGEVGYISVYLPISLYLLISPYISLYLPTCLPKSPYISR